MKSIIRDMSISNDVQTIAGPYVPPHQTETSPLRQNIFTKTGLSVVKFLWGWDESPDKSLRIVVAALFGSAGIITLALFTQLHYGNYRLPEHGAIVSDSPQCSSIGLNILKSGGNAVDAAIACTFCLGVVHFHVTGLGGGGSSIIYNDKKQEVVDVLDFQPSVYADTTVAVPGLLLGLWSLHQRHGKMSWQNLVTPSVRLARNGFIIEKSLVDAKRYLKGSPKSTNLYSLMTTLLEGRTLMLPKLADTLRLIALEGPYGFYNGTLAADIEYSIKLAGENFTKANLARYEPIQRDSIRTRFFDFNVIVPSKSFGSDLLIQTLDDIMILDLSSKDEDSLIQKVSLTLYDEFKKLSQKYNAALNFLDTVGTPVVAVDNDFNYVSVVSGLNTWLGSQIMTEFGFILNNAIINGGVNEDKRPIHLYTPVIALQSGSICGNRFIMGAGDSKMALEVLTQLLIKKYETIMSVESPRFLIGNESQILRLEVQHYPQFPDRILSSLSINGTKVLTDVNPPYQSVNLISIFQDYISPYADSRGGGEGVQF